MKIYSIHFNRPSFISTQLSTCRKFGHELIVVNNGKNEAIHRTCRNLGVQEIPTKNIGRLSFSHANSINQLFKMKSAKEDCGIIDHDVFLKGPVDFRDNDIIGLKQTRNNLNYFWPGFLFWRKYVPIELIDFTPCRKSDTGVNTSLLYDKIGIKTKLVEEKRIRDTDKPMHSHGFSELYLYGKLIAIHAINGSNWHSQYNQSKILKLTERIIA